MHWNLGDTDSNGSGLRSVSPSGQSFPSQTSSTLESNLAADFVLPSDQQRLETKSQVLRNPSLTLSLPPT
ncbi:uncharacterized protein L969DRAFT_95120 [Mixia osmundae IAM 14324]|uniref:Uncharacterized protein n=1 Tax=Mixia osmundae (strain CBS 9802 / IAM 14324 / JCM 22182 / KY 12970) TaxID=764103 RepID=G7E7F2_MIXOS|nr:uncharacterized protein L969DRAFT_95120 [Mixia osmundae IAM 14324]KEI38922.1 hypothetical protein L969DRAFT_95120 [Mixia osmundae IAM 14324]GAA98762.1 hypothetical protein E5Q_05450 [Mixia osmundae IAM 14324]